MERNEVVKFISGSLKHLVMIKNGAIDHMQSPRPKLSVEEKLDLDEGANVVAILCETKYVVVEVVVGLKYVRLKSPTKKDLNIYPLEDYRFPLRDAVKAVNMY